MLSWRKGDGSRRYVIGVLKRNKVEGVRFSYIEEGVLSARKEGFTPYTEFPEVNKIYTKNVLEIFGQRLLKVERSDSSDFFRFWEIDEKYKEDKFYLLAHTMGLTPTDNFEFLADYNPVRELKFITDIAGISYRKLDKTCLEVGDRLRVLFEPNNEFDKNAVAVYKDDLHLGYIKIVHNLVFHKKRGSNISLIVKAREVNGSLKKAFVKVSFDG